MAYSGKRMEVGKGLGKKIEGDGVGGWVEERDVNYGEKCKRQMGVWKVGWGMNGWMNG